MDLSFDGLKLAHVPIIYQLFKADIYSKVPIRPLSQQSKNIRTLSHHTVVTPKVYALSMAFFLQHFRIVKPYNQVLSYKHSSNMGEIHGASPKIKWIGYPSISFVYAAVKIGKTVYLVKHLSLFSLVLYLILIY